MINHKLFFFIFILCYILFYVIFYFILFYFIYIYIYNFLTFSSVLAQHACIFSMKALYLSFKKLFFQF